jgi:RNA polymerase sigma-70 factor (ECF subfamily)
MVMDDEEKILKRLQQFDERALSEVYDACSPGIYRYAWRLLGDEDMAEDCVAETFSRLLKALERGKGPRQHLQAYLYRVAHNWITDQYRRGSHLEYPLEYSTHVDPDPDPLTQISIGMEQAELRTALRLLTPEQRQVILLRYLEGWQLSEIAQALEKPVGAVKALQHRGLNSLRRILTRENEAVA